MKLFLTKVLLYVGILLVIIVPVSLHFFNRIPKQLMLVSNSVSYNLKADFIRQHPEKLREAGIVVVGSSMSLNNVDAVMLQDSFRLPTVNCSSWGLTINNYEGSPIWNQHKIFLSNVGVADFDAPSVDVRDNFSFHTSRLREFLNFEMDFKTFWSLIPQLKETIAIPDNRTYTSCNFDECGSVLFSDSGFDITPKRWEEDAYLIFKMDSGAVRNYVYHLKELTASHHGFTKLIVSLSPVRRKFYNQTRAEVVAYLGQMIRTTCNDVSFFDLYDHDYPDSDYVDNCHFNTRGARRFTRELIDSIRSHSLIP